MRNLVTKYLGMRLSTEPVTVPDNCKSSQIHSVRIDSTLFPCSYQCAHTVGSKTNGFCIMCFGKLCSSLDLCAFFIALLIEFLKSLVLSPKICQRGLHKGSNINLGITSILMNIMMNGRIEAAST